MNRFGTCVALVVLGAIAIGQGELRADERADLLKALDDMGSDTVEGIYFKQVRIPRELDRFRATALKVGNLARRDPDWRKNNAKPKVAFDLSGDTVFIPRNPNYPQSVDETVKIFKPLNDLVLNEKLNNAAQFQAEYQAAFKPGHYGPEVYSPDGSTQVNMKEVGDRLKYFGYTGGIEGEGAGGGLKASADPEGLMKGDTHFRPWFNIGADAREEGVGIALDAKEDTNGDKYWRTTFIAGTGSGNSGLRKESARLAPPVGVIKTVDLAKSSLIVKNGATEHKYTLAKDAKVHLADGKPAKPGALHEGMSVLKLAFAANDKTTVTEITVEQHAPAPKVDPKDPAQAKADYTKHMNAGNTDVQQKRYAAAVKEFEAALRIMPGDMAATAALKQAKAHVDQAKPEPKNEPAPKVDPKKDPAPANADYTKHMNAGNAAEQQKRYAAAVKEFEAALQIMPGDAAATAALKQAKAQLQQATADFNKHMKDGQAALQNKKYPDAVKEFQAALAIRPGDKDATALLEQAKAQLKKQ